MVPVCLNEQLLAGTIEHAIDWIIDHEIDTSRFDAHYRDDEGGRPAYNPKALLKVVLFGYSKGILSSRGIERACRTNIVFMALCGDVYPDHATIARFVTAHGAAVRQMFRDVLLIAAQGDLVGAEVFALDGCKISSNAAKEHSGSHAELRRKIEKIEHRLTAMMDEHRSRDDRDDDADQNRPDPPQGIERYQSQIDRIKGFLGEEKARLLMADMEACATVVYPRKLHQAVPRDSDDDAAVDCAVESGSFYIVSGDSHLTETDVLEGASVITPKRFVELLKLE